MCLGSRFIQASACLAVICYAIPQTACGSSVAPMPLTTIADSAAQVIQGEVASVRSYWADNPRRIESEVTFKNVGYLKGQHTDSSPTFTLTVPGGTVGQMEMRICCAPTFVPGQQWVLFLLPTYKTFPVVGLYRGAFRIQSDADGIERIFSSDGQPVTGVNKDAMLEIAGCVNHDPHLVVSKAHNVRLGLNLAAAGSDKAIALDDFIATITPVLNRSKDHQLTHNAGRRILVDYQATQLHPANPPGQTDGKGMRSGGLAHETANNSRERRAK